MAILRSLDVFLRKPDPAARILLIHGEDPVAVRGLAARVVQAVAGCVDDPFNVVTLEDEVVADPGRVIDEVLSLSLLGGARVIWVRGADQNLLKAIAPVLDGSVSGNLIVAEAGKLAKSSPLRVRLEENDRALVLAVHEAGAADLRGSVEAILRREGLRIAPDAAERLFELLGRGGLALQREVEKLAIYCQPSDEISAEDVEAICGDGLWAGLDDVVDAVFLGLMSEVDDCFRQIIASGVDAGRILMAAHAHAQRLCDLRLAVDRGMRIEQVVKTARPPVFFKRQANMQAQLSIWSNSALLSAAATLSSAVLQARLNSGLAESLANRTLLGLARSARPGLARTI